jgi:hypothetical protein
MTAPATAKQGATIVPMDHLERAALLALYRDGDPAEREAARRELDRRGAIAAAERRRPTTADTRAGRWPRDDWRRRQAGDE